MIFLYVNHPLYRHGDRYFAPTRNFVDFMAVLAEQGDNYQLIVPCREVGEQEIEDLSELHLPGEVHEVAFYRGHLAALLKTPIQAFRIRQIVSRAASIERVCIGGPGPNSMLFWLSLLLPKSTRFLFFIRGDTVETVRHIYRDRWWGKLPVAISGLFQKRIFDLLGQERAVVFTYGEALEAKYRAHGQAVHTISPLIDESVVRETPRPPIPQDRSLRVLFVGRLSAEKGVSELVAALARLRSRGIELRLDVAGTGVLQDRLQEEAAREEVSDFVTFHGHVPPGPMLWDLYDSCDLLCLPSRTEGTPRVVVEAFARGMPVLATRVGSIESMFPENLVFIEKGTPDGIAEGLAWCDQNRERLSESGRNGQAAVDRFLLSSNAAYVDKVLKGSSEQVIPE
ncbi:glycosyltransferase family 4 protein [Thiohalophilus sp.]|uniref:glycosyltransferase family 4 protein n=1 Tax=Thiohalophilus sp. TaxID=3028392 RepID=UPI002ACE0C32|nr:glycosyltransferase family 4 protein [Thiohalophilus sp.]MDZ7804411.1 glycosyltransferase family 4 protein [Thiohalophilus sp.]